MNKFRSVKFAAVFALAGVAGGLSPARAQTYEAYGGRQEYQVITQPASHPFEESYSYPYDPNTDPKRNYMVQKAPEPDYSKELATASGLDIGLQVSDYNYQEPSLGVMLVGPKLGVTAAVTGTFGHGWFISADARGAFGESDYTGSGTASGNFEELWDVRGLIGHDFAFRNFDLSPYLGIGFRDLYSDDRGASSTGANGYRRENVLYYIPIGIEPRFAVMPGARIATKLEYDYVAEGHEFTTLSDVDPGLPNLTNKQSSGYGLRADIMWETRNWALGPFLTYWSIGQSNTVCADGTVYSICGDEPANHTVEGGIQFRYHIY